MNEAQQRVGAALSACVDMVKGMVGQPYAVTIFCRHRSGPGHILLGDDDAPQLIAGAKELERFGTTLVQNGEELPEEQPATDRMAILLGEAAERFREYEAHHREEVRRMEAGNGDVQPDRSAERADREAKAERNAEIAARIEAMLVEMGLAESPADECEHPNATPVLGKICTYECPDCEIEFTRTRPSNTVRVDVQDNEPEFTAKDHFLLDWLSKEDASQYGECKGPDLDRLMGLGLVEWKQRDSRGDDYGTVALTEAGIAKARELGEWKP